RGLDQPARKRVGDGTEWGTARILRRHVRRVLAEARRQTAVGGREVEDRPTAPEHGLGIELVGGADARLEIIQIAVKWRAGKAVLAGEADAAVDFIAGEFGLVDLARDGVHLVAEEVAIEPVETLVDGRGDVPTQSEIEGQLAGELDIILDPGRGVDPLEEWIRRETR